MKKITALLLIAIIFLSGCATKWTTEDEPTPFIAANKLAVSQSRTVQDLTTLMNTTGERNESRWSDGENVHIRKNEVMIELENYLLRTEYYDSLQKSGGHIYHEVFDTLNVRINSHRLYLVSLKPTTLVLIPIHYDKPEKPSYSNFAIRDMLGTPNNSILGFHGFHGLIESIYSGTTIPYDDNVLWCAPSIGGEPKPINKNSSGQYEIKFEGCVVILTKTNNTFEVERIK